MRHFKSGATRSSSQGKYEYVGFQHPLVEHSFAKYMNKHRRQEDGKLRDSNNWWKGWGKKDTIQSLARHERDIEAIYSGLIVAKVKEKNGEYEHTYYLLPGDTIDVNKNEIVECPTEEECVNALKFNCNAYILSLLTNNNSTEEHYYEDTGSYKRIENI